MEEVNSQDSEQSKESNDLKGSDSFSIVGFEADLPPKSVFKLFGYELIAPTGMKNPAFIYILFVIVNLIIFLFLILKTRL